MKAKQKIGIAALTACCMTAVAWADDISVAASVTPESAYSDAVMAIEDNREAVVAELLSQWSGSLSGDQSQLAATLPYLSPHKLYAAQQANSVEQLQVAIAPREFANKADFVAGPAFVGDPAGDWSYTAVTPCRAVDTRFQTSPQTGPIAGGGTRAFYVYGGISNQNGGSPVSCPTPQGEPLGVHLNVTVVPQAGQGNVRVYPADIATPTVSLVNFKPGVNIANAATVKTYNFLGPEEIEVYASATAHVIIDIMGYYFAAPAPIGVEYASVAVLSDLTGGNEVVASITMTVPTDGHVIVNGQGFFDFNSIVGTLDSAGCGISTSTALDVGNFVTESGDGDFEIDDRGSFATSRGYAVTAGDYTFNMVCQEVTGDVEVENVQLNAVFSPYRY